MALDFDDELVLVGGAASNPQSPRSNSVPDARGRGRRVGLASEQPIEQTCMSGPFVFKVGADGAFSSARLALASA